MSLKLALNFLAFLILSACAQGVKTEHCPENQRKHKIALQDSIKFPLDTNSSAGGMNFFYHKISDKRYFGFYNPFVHAIYVYDYSETRLTKIINLEKEGPNSVSTNLTSIGMVDSNSIALVEASIGVLKLIDFDAKVLKEIRLFQTDDFGKIAPPSSNLARPIIEHGNTIYLTGRSPGVEYVADHTRFLNAYEVDLSSNTIDFYLPRPSIYNTGQYGLMPLYQIYCTLNLSQNGILYGFGLTPDIYEMKFDQPDSLTSHCMRSDQIGYIKPLAADLDDINTGQMSQIREYDQNINYYMNLYALPGTNHYVRFNSIGPNFDGDKSRKTTISIFDERFAMLGETSMPENLRYGYNIFANDKGLHLLKREQDEDYLTLFIYGVVPSE